MRAFFGSLFELLASLLYTAQTVFEGATCLTIGARAFCLGLAEQLLPVRIPQLTRDRAMAAGRKAAGVVGGQAAQFGVQKQQLEVVGRDTWNSQ